MVNNIMFLVRELVASLPAVSKTNPPGKASEFENNLSKELLAETTQKQKNVLGVPRGRVDSPEKENNNSQTSFQDSPSLIPLPFKTPFYDGARFYVQQERSGNAKKEEIRLLILLDTINIGLLRLILSQKENDLTLQWIVQTEEVKRCIEQGFSDLKKEIMDLGYEAVSLNIQCSPKEGEKNKGIPGSDLHAQESIFNYYV